MNIQLKDISKSYNNTVVLNKLDIEIKKHQITCIMGPSGVGKTTLIYIILGLVEADSGSIVGLSGKKFAAVFQENRLCEGINAIKNVQLVCEKTITDFQIKEEFRKVLLSEYDNKPVSELSGGMKRRVAIVRALLSESDIIIMDEPFKGLDEELKIQVINYIKYKTKGKTVIIITHDKEEVDALSAELINL